MIEDGRERSDVQKKCERPPRCLTATSTGGDLETLPSGYMQRTLD
jgi:hypothetical protein